MARHKGRKDNRGTAQEGRNMETTPTAKQGNEGRKKTATEWLRENGALPKLTERLRSERGGGK